MSARPATLFELFGDFTALWPVESLRETIGSVVGDPEDLAAWLAALNAALKIRNIRLGSLDGRAALEADVSMDNTLSGYPDGFPVVLSAMPDLEFRLLGDGNSSSKLFASVDAAGIPEVVIEGVPVEIRLPAGLAEPHPGPADHPSGIASQTVGKFTPGVADDMEIVYNSAGPTTVRVHVRVHMTSDGEFSLRPAVPISFGPCLFSGIPCKAVHDFSLIPSPGLIPRTVEWIRFKDLAKTQAGAPDIGTEGGAFGVRSIHLDMAAAPLKGAADWLKGHADKELPAEVVLDDLVVPFFGVPRHLTAGIRRGIVDPKDPKQSYFFDKAPVQVYFCRDPSFGLTIESLFVQVPEVEEAVDEDDPTLHGVTLAASLFYAGESTAQPEPGEGEPRPLSPRALELSLGENLTPRLTYRRAFDGDTGLPASGEGAGRLVNALLHHVVAGTTIDVMALRLGLSLGKLLGDDASFLDSAEATFDVFVSSPPTGDDDAFFKLRGLDGEKIAFAIEGIGWRQGTLSALGSGLPQLPDGVAVFFGPVKIIIQEIGLLAEKGATYLSMTAGVDTPLPKQLRGSIVLKRARFKLSGLAEAPAFLLDGVFVRLQSGTLLIEAGGFYTQRTEGDVRVREFGMSGSVQLRVGQTDYGLALDLLVGSIRSPAERFRYFMAQAIYRSVILGSFEIRNARLLFANNLQPKLQPADVAAGGLRYYNWHRQTNPLNVPGDRRLLGWQPQEGAWTLGVGAGASLPALGKICELNAFILAVDGDDESGALFTGELTALSNPKPLGFFALDADNTTDRVSLVIGVDVKLAEFLKEPPEWSRNIAELSGSLFVSNKPASFALGRLADQRTWLSLRFDVDFILKSFVKFAFCFETTSGGPSGFGFVVSIEGGIKSGSKFQLTYLARFAIAAACFSTGSSDGSVTISIELAARVVLFRIIRLGLSLLAELRYIGSRPARTEALLRFRFETPWYLPDVTWTLDMTFGESDPGALSTAVSPLRLAAAIEGPGRSNAPLHLARFAPDDPDFDPDWDGSGTAPTFSVRQFAGPASAEATRLERFEANTSVRPIAIDATIAIDWNVAVNDQLSLGADTAGGLGTQSSGELELTYDLVGIQVRRRARFGPDRSWRGLEDVEELAADFTDPNGIGLQGEYGPQALAKVWDHDLRIDGRSAAKRLLINASTPFSFTTGDNETDESTISENPNWPCCRPQDQDGPGYSVHVVEFRDEPPGRRILGDRVFSESQSRLRLLRPAIVRPSLVGQLTPPNAVVAFLTSATPGPFLRTEFDEAAAFCALRIAWGRTAGVLCLVGFDALGEVVARRELPLGSASGYQDILLTARGAMHRMEARLLLPPEQGPAAGTTIHVPPARGIALEIDRVSYVGLRAYLDDLRLDLACQGAEGTGAIGYSGHGKLFFLPNHDYEIAVTTRITVAHPGKSPESADVTEHVYFKTKGLPGLNAVARPGEELDPYVAAAYGGGKGLLYREEPAVLAFTESFLVAVPLASRPAAGTSEEHVTLQQLQLLVEPAIAATPGTIMTSTAGDWIVEHRTVFPGPIRNHWTSVASKSLLVPAPMRSRDPFRLRLARLTQRDQATCRLPDPRGVTGSVLLAPPQGDPHPSLPDAEIWPAATAMTAVARSRGAPFVGRRPFVAADRTAFRFASAAAPDAGTSWTVEEGRLRLSSASAQRFVLFGDTDWNHLTVQVEVTLDRSAGVGVALPQAAPLEGLFATLERAGGALDLVIRSRVAGGAFLELSRRTVTGAPGPESAVTLVVDAFDDRLRATVLDTSVEVDRDALREGRIGLFGEGEATFSALEVHGLDLFRFPFATSRFVSFADHIGSFPGTVAVARPNDLGPATTTTTLADLWSATRGEIEAAMRPEADAPTRQALFDRWVAGLGLPIRQEVRKLALTQFVEAAQAGLILLESPEPLDFAEEVALKGARVQGRAQPRIVVPLPRGAPGRNAPIPGAGRGGDSRPPDLDTRERREKVIQSVVAIQDGYRVELNAAALAEVVTPRGEVVIAERITRGIGFYRGRLTRPPRGATRVFVNVLEESFLPRPGPTLPIPILQALRQLAIGSFALLNAARTAIVDVFVPPRPEPPIELSVLQDGAGLRALLIPHRGAAHQVLDAGAYELRFEMDRQRWPAQAPPEAASRYQANAALMVEI